MPAPVICKFRVDSGESHHISSTTEHRSFSNHHRSENIARSTLFNQFDCKDFSRHINNFFDSMMETIDAIDQILSNAVLRFPHSPEVKKSTAQQTVKSLSEKFYPKKRNKASDSRNVEESLLAAIEKADSILRNFDALLLLSVKALGGFSSFANKELADVADANEVAELPRAVSIDLPKIVPQTGHICKPTALANIDAYYAHQHGVSSIPLRKNHKFRFDSESTFSPNVRHSISIRELSKRHGSIQGEVLEAEQYQQLAIKMGYSVEIMSPENSAAFKQLVLSHLANGHPLVACFAVDRKTGQPESNYSDNEHACVITGCDPVTNTIDIVHWGKTFHAIPIDDMFDSMNTLPEEREQEIYYRCEEFNDASHLEAVNRKYDKEDRRLKGGEKGKTKSIIPMPGSGFKNKVFSIVPDSNSSRWNQHLPADHFLE